MARAIVMPSLGMYIAEGKLLQWLRPLGARVAAGEAIALLETEKAAYELEAVAAGILHPVAGVGTVLPVEGLLGYILADGEAPPTDAPSSGADAAPAFPPGTHTPRASTVPRDEVRASPIAKRLAREHGIDLSRLVGRGPEGRILEADVMDAVAKGSSPAASAVSSRAVRARIPLTGMRGAIADRLRHSLTTAASITITREVRAAALVQARGRAATTFGIDVPYDALFVKLFAAALREHPIFNSTIERDTILVLDEVHVGFAVALPRGLIVPVVRNAGTEPLSSIARTVRELTERARASKLRPADVTEGTASISNLGSYGVDAFTPILNPPESAILGIGRITERPVVDGDGIVASATCLLSLTFDHRVADGAPAAQLLESLAQKIQDESYLHTLST